MSHHLRLTLDPSLDPELDPRIDALGLTVDDIDLVAEEMFAIGLPADVDQDQYLRARDFYLEGTIPLGRLRDVTLWLQEGRDRRDRMIARLAASVN